MDTNTPTKEVSDMEMEDLTLRMEELSTHPIATNLIEIQNFFDRPMACINKFRRPVMVPKNIKDENGYFPVVVSSIDLIDLENIVYSVYLACLKQELIGYKTLLNLTYEDNATPLLMNASDYKKLSTSLIMIKIGEDWIRCIEISKTDNVIVLEDIDTGKKHSFKSSFSFKKPQKQELARNAFIFKVNLKNVHDRTAIDVGDIIKIRIKSFNLRGVSDAETELYETQERPVEIEKPQNVQVIFANSTESLSVQEEPRIMIKDLKVKNFPTGPQELFYIDGSKLNVGKAHVCLVSDENSEAQLKLFDGIQEYIYNNEDKNGYKPK